MKHKIIKTVVAGAAYVLKNEDCRKALLGSYSDGTPRSLVDAIQGEFVSTKDREKINKKNKKKNK